MGFPNLESALKILRHHRVHEMLDGVFFADEAQEKEPRAKSNQNYQGYAAYRVAESFRVRFFASRIKEGQIYPRLCCVPPLRVGTKLLREQRKLAESPSRSKLQPMSWVRFRVADNTPRIPGYGIAIYPIQTSWLISMPWVATAQTA